MTKMTATAWTGIRPDFFWAAWGVMMFVSIAGMVLGFWQDGRPDLASSSAALVFLSMGGFYRRRMLTRAG